MIHLHATLATAVALLVMWPIAGESAAPVLVAQASPADKQANCRKACDEAVAVLRGIPAQPGRDQKSKDELEKKIVALIAENRRKSIDDCTTWGQVLGMAFTQ